ncbi:MAG: ComF family protein [Acidobacteria bacterium]|nr:ComF family protein [Acidobacteriota bacterium]MCB9398095.1 ComF family protein [Acidobacteriota bacterium]
MASWADWNPLELFAPKLCLVCGQAGEALCAQCRRALEPIAAGCRRCGYPGIQNKSGSPQSGGCFWCKPLRGLPSAADMKSQFVYRNAGKALFQQAKFQTYFRAIDGLLDPPDALVAWIKAGGFQVVCPIPERFERMWRRPFNPAERIARILCRGAELPLVHWLRCRGQRSQVGLARKGRRSNPRFICTVSAEQLAGKKVLLVDDVLTTGSTLSAASRALRMAGCAQIGWFTLFRAL